MNEDYEINKHTCYVFCYLKYLRKDNNTLLFIGQNNKIEKTFHLVYYTLFSELRLP